MIEYRTPSFDEFVIGFKFESCYWLFTDHVDQEWVEVEITEDNIEDFQSLYDSDAYPTEFRVKI